VASQGYPSGHVSLKVACYRQKKSCLLSMMDILSRSREEIKGKPPHPRTHYQQGPVLYTPKRRSEALFMLKKGRVRIYRIWTDRGVHAHRGGRRNRDSERCPSRHNASRTPTRKAMESAVVCKMQRYDLNIVTDKPQVVQAHQHP